MSAVNNNSNDILNQRRCGVLMPIFSVDSPYGIGTLGKACYNFVDWLADEGQSYWQVLPVHPTTLENSPYTAFSSMAGNELFIDLDELVADKYLSQADIDAVFGASGSIGSLPAGRINYKKVRASRDELFAIAVDNFRKNVPGDFYAFCEVNQYWLDDYALFMAIKISLGMKKLKHWPEPLKFKEHAALIDFMNGHESLIEQVKILQFLFHKQWSALKNYANEQGVYIIGDMPYYVANDSADVWANPEVFLLDDKLKSTQVAGCPPDLFSEDGQLWGNPIYNWKYLKQNRYDWWTRRIAKSFELYDVLRIDHFRGFESYYSIDAESKTARNGLWVKGPGYDFFRVMEKAIGHKQIIAEDLGYITADVRQLLRDTGYPGMKVLQFAFDSREEDQSYFPYKYPRNSVVYIGTHDNDTCLGWVESICKDDLKMALDYYGLSAGEVDKLPAAIMYSAMGSVANTCILCVQDILKLGSSGRINTPATVGTNWKWRITPAQMKKLPKFGLGHLTEMFGRSKNQ